MLNAPFAARAHRQMLYLVKETVVFALCDDIAPSFDKKKIVQQLLDSDRLQVFLPMKPEFKFHKLLGKPHDCPNLKDFVGLRSWLVFDLPDELGKL